MILLLQLLILGMIQVCDKEGAVQLTLLDTWQAGGCYLRRVCSLVTTQPAAEPTNEFAA